jgi:3-oxoacyl-[acyl-carrier protein] reductase
VDAKLSDKYVLITGASGGIGQATARAFAEEGAGLALHYNTQAEPVEELQRQLEVDAVCVQADLREESRVDTMFAEVLEVFPRLDSVIVNAAIGDSRKTPLHEMTSGQWKRMLDANLTSAFLTCRAFLRHLAEVPRESASIVLVGSTAAIFGEADHGDYAAAKAGMSYGLTRTLKNEIVRLASRGRVNCVCPGWTETPMALDFMNDPAAVSRATATMPMRKVAQPEDVARAIVFLASNHLAGHISGAVLPVAGGMEGRLLNDP